MHGSETGTDDLVGNDVESFERPQHAEVRHAVRTTATEHEHGARATGAGSTIAARRGVCIRSAHARMNC